MSLASILDRKIALVSRAVFIWRWRNQDRLSRFARGIAYAFGRPLSEGARHSLRVEMNEALGYYPLMTLGAEDVLHEAEGRYGAEEASKLAPYLHAACDRVASKWDNDSDAFGFAVDWALENALTYAQHEGVSLTLLD